jgi:hypothetical protein
VHSRYALIRYQDTDKRWRVGSGLIVRDRAVLTADHITNGTQHRVECADKTIAVQSIVRSGTAGVDLAVLMLAEPVAGLAPMHCARVDRSEPARRLDGCVAVGFPFWRRDGHGRVTVQVEGFIRTGDDLRMLVAGGTDGQPLTLMGDRVPGQPDLPEGTIDYGPGSPWAGMSGAVVVARGLVIGVIHSHQLGKGFQSLTVTPLTALKLLPAEKYQEFCAALGIGDVDQLTLLTADPQPMMTGLVARPPQVPTAAAELSRRVRERYAHELVMAGLAVPDRWDLATLDPLLRDCQHKALSQAATAGMKRAAEALEALCDAAAALPALAEVRKTISTKKLQHLYLRHVRSWPEASGLDEMLVLAASVGIADRRRPVTDHGNQPESLTALAKFLLGMAAHWKGPGPVTLDDPDLRGLAELVSGRLEVPPHDAAQFLASIRRRSWALIEFVGPDLSTRDWPTFVRVESVPERGEPESQTFKCASPSLAGVEDALRGAVDWLPEGDVYIDLCLPRHWLDAGVEHWNVVDVGGVYESLSPDYKPRLRWSMHQNNGALRDRLRRRFESVDWLADAEDIPADLAADEARFTGWLTGRDLPGMKHPPYLAGGSPRAGSHDPLAAMLRKGYGCITWFGKETADDVRQHALHAAVGLSGQARRDDLPEVLAATLAAHRPAIIWSDPDGRADFPMPPPRPAGSLRRGRQ